MYRSTNCKTRTWSSNCLSLWKPRSRDWNCISRLSLIQRVGDLRRQQLNIYNNYLLSHPQPADYVWRTREQISQSLKSPIPPLWSGGQSRVWDLRWLWLFHCHPTCSFLFWGCLGSDICWKAESSLYLLVTTLYFSMSIWAGRKGRILSGSRSSPDLNYFSYQNRGIKIIETQFTLQYQEGVLGFIPILKITQVYYPSSFYIKG